MAEEVLKKVIREEKENERIKDPEVCLLCQACDSDWIPTSNALGKVLVLSYLLPTPFYLKKFTERSKVPKKTKKNSNNIIK